MKSHVGSFAPRRGNLDLYLIHGSYSFGEVRIASSIIVLPGVCCAESHVEEEKAPLLLCHRV